jgi:hypothetical protein
MRTLESFRNGTLRLLCASDVAARGLDIPDVSHVFNYDVPHHADDYVPPHRPHRPRRQVRPGVHDRDPGRQPQPRQGAEADRQGPEEIKLEGIDWSSIKDEPRSPRGGGRERTGGRDRDRTRDRKPPVDHRPRADTASMEPLAPEPPGRGPCPTAAR